MGRTALFLVMGLGVAMSYIGFQIYRSGQVASDIQFAYVKYANARNLAQTSIHATLRWIDRDGTGNAPPVNVNTNFNGGYYRLDSVWRSVNTDTLRLVSRGVYAESSYTMRVLLGRTTRPFPTVKGAIGIRATPVSLTLSGSPNIDGKNYDTTGTVLVGSGNLPGITTMKNTDSTNVAIAGGSNVQGNPPVKVDTTIQDPLDFLDIYKNSAHITFNTSGTYSGQTWGAPGNPVIVYCNAGDDTSFSIKFTGGVVGYGILVVKGNVQFNGNLTFRGLVIVDGFNTTVQFGASGTPAVVGGIVVAGNAGASVSLRGTGSNAKVRYSSQAIALAQNIRRLLFYTVLDWYE